MWRRYDDVNAKRCFLSICYAEAQPFFVLLLPGTCSSYRTFWFRRYSYPIFCTVVLKTRWKTACSQATGDIFTDFHEYTLEHLFFDGRRNALAPRIRDT